MQGVELTLQTVNALVETALNQFIDFQTAEGDVQIMEGSLQSWLSRIASASLDSSHRINHLGDAVAHRAWEFPIQQ